MSDGLGGSVQEQAGAVVPTTDRVSLIKFDTTPGQDCI